MNDLVKTAHDILIPGLSQPIELSENLLGADNDSEALTMFLNKAGARSVETRRRYEREIVRFTAYIYQELAVNYRSVRLKHLQTYLYFIQNIPRRWLQPGILPGQPDKVLFKDSINKGKSTDQVIDVLSTFFSFLEKNLYTIGNPAVSLVRSGEKRARGSTTVRYFYESEWQHVRESLYALPCTTPAQIREATRSRFMIRLTYGLALRESEITLHSCADIHPDDDGGYFLSVVGKGRKRRNLPLNSDLQEGIMEFRRMYGCRGINNDTLPLAPRRRMNQGVLTGLTQRGLRFWWQGFMEYCAQRTDNINLQFRLREMPFHALRHTALTHLARKMDIEDLAIFAGHDSINTTSQYYHAEASRLKKLTRNHQL